MGSSSDMLNYTNIEIRLFDGGTGLRKWWNPDIELRVSWELLEEGGTGQITVDAAAPFELPPANPTDIIEVWVSGESVPRVRGIVSNPEADLDLKEKHQLVAYGFMEDMNHVLLDKIMCYPGGTDLSWFAAQLADDYAAHRPNLKFIRDIQTVYVTLETLDASDSIQRDVWDTIFEQMSHNGVWGWDIDPVSGLSRLYLRPRQTQIGYQFFVGNNVKLLNRPIEITGLTNAVKVKGGPAKYPQFITNPGFEVPQVPSGASGNMLGEGDFESTVAFDAGDPWVYLNGASRNKYQLYPKNDAQAHSGEWYVILDHDTEEIYQEIVVALNTQYNASLYIAAESGAHLPTGRMIIEGRDSSDAVTETWSPALALTPTGTSWTGGQPSTVLASNALSQSGMFTNPATVKARVRVVADSAYGATYGLLVDDVVFAPNGGVGQYGWGTHTHDGLSADNEFGPINWACAAAAKEGAYGVRLQVLTASTAHTCVLAPEPQDNTADSGYHFKPAAQQSLYCYAYVRMAPGTTADGKAWVTYREWTSNGSVTQAVMSPGAPGTPVTIPMDGTWTILPLSVTTHGDVSQCTFQVEFAAAGIYDVDEVSVRDAASSSDTFLLRSTTFECYVKCTDAGMCTMGSPSYNSIADYSLREGILEDSDIVDWGAGSQSYVKAWFDRNAVPLIRPTLELTNEVEQTPDPGSGLQVTVSGFSNGGADVTDWAAKALYTFEGSRLGVHVDMDSQRPTWATLLKSLSGGSSSSSTLSALGAAAASSGSGSGGTSPTLPIDESDVNDLVTDLEPLKTNQAAATVYAGPATGADALAAFRALVATDIPAIAQSQVTGLVAALAALTAAIGETGTYPPSTVEAAVGGAIAAGTGCVVYTGSGGATFGLPPITATSVPLTIINSSGSTTVNPSGSDQVDGGSSATYTNDCTLYPVLKSGSPSYWRSLHIA